MQNIFPAPHHGHLPGLLQKVDIFSQLYIDVFALCNVLYHAASANRASALINVEFSDLVHPPDISRRGNDAVFRLKA